MSVEDAAKLLRAVERSFNDVPRNDYEGNNRYLANTERLAEAEKRLAGFSGDRINEMLARLEALRSRNEAVRLSTSAAVGRPGAASSGGAFSIDFVEEEDTAGHDDELAAAEVALSKASKKKKERKSANKEKKASGKGESSPPPALTGEEGYSVPATPVVVEDGLVGAGGSDAQARTPPPAPVEPLSRRDACPSDAVPADILGTTGLCATIAGTAWASVTFPDATFEVEDRPCHCRVEMYRCVLIALVHGAPVARQSSASSSLPERSACQDSVSLEEGSGAEMDTGDEGGGELEPPVDEETEHLQSLSKELVLLYDAAQAAKEEEEAGSLFPVKMPVSVLPSLRHATYLPWVILTCMGGYFAGGVFVDGKCVCHRAFQRYVVRKKQGGRQSTSGKDGGSYGSVGSQIRAAQEAKWRLEVRDTLLEWGRWIDEAAFILYAAPGPQNSTMLTDFSQLPPHSSGKRLQSPIRLSDPRVAKVPLTTHRPTFREVERIYEAVSRFNLLFVP